MSLKYVEVVPANVSVVGGVYSMSVPAPVPGTVECHILAQKQSTLSPYDATADRREIWVLKSVSDIDMSNWITNNSTMVTEKTFAEADAIGKELQPAQNINVHKVIMEDGAITSDTQVPTAIAAFDLQSELDKRGI